MAQHDQVIACPRRVAFSGTSGPRAEGFLRLRDIIPSQPLIERRPTNPEVPTRGGHITAGAVMCHPGTPLNCCVDYHACLPESLRCQWPEAAHPGYREV